MGELILRVAKDTWTQDDIGTILTTMLPTLASKGVIISNIEVNSTTEIRVIGKGEAFTYIKFGELKTLVDTYCSQNEINIKIFAWEL